MDTNGAQSIKNAWAGGMSHVDAYIFPCYSCGDAAGQMDTAINSLAAANATYGMMWLDIEDGGGWSSDYDANAKFAAELAAEGEARGITIGVYTSSYEWGLVCGTSTALSSYPLWLVSLYMICPSLF